MERASDWTVEVLPKVDYSLCGFSPVHGDKIAVFDVYLDESGTHDDKRLVVGVCIRGGKVGSLLTGLEKSFDGIFLVPLSHEGVSESASESI